METPVANPLNVYKKMKPEAIAEIAEAVKAIVTRHHGFDNSRHSEVDYCAVALFCMVEEDAKTFKYTPKRRRLHYAEALKTAKRIREWMEEGGIAALKY